MDIYIHIGMKILSLIEFHNYHSVTQTSAGDDQSTSPAHK